MSQRNVLEPSGGLQSQEDELREMVLEFFEEHLQERFPEADYTFDVYITTAGKVHTSAVLGPFKTLPSGAAGLIATSNTWDSIIHPSCLLHLVIPLP